MTLAPFISAISLAVLVFLTVVLVIDRNRPRGTGYLIVLLTVLACFITLRLCFDLASPLIVWLPFIAFPGAFFYGPLILLYSGSVLFGRSVSRNLVLGITVAPLTVLITHALLHIRFAEMRGVADILQQTGIILGYTRTLLLVGTVYTLLFILMALRNLRNYEKAYQENFAGNDRDQLTWLKVFVSLNLILTASFAGAGLVVLLLDLKIPTTPVEGIIALIMIYVILYYFIRKPAIFTLPPNVVAAAPQQVTEKYRKQNLSDTERKAYMQKIEKYLAEEKPFLDDKVTLATLARETGIPAHHFSMVINIERQTNFYHFINSYRVEEAKSLLKNPDMADETVLDIALMAGFQSKAAFNKVFKEITGFTPSAYREQNGQTGERTEATN